MDFETGKLRGVAHRQHPSQRREYALFGSLLILTTVPYAIAMFYRPLGTGCVMLFMAYFQVLATLARSSGTSTSHYMRFTLSGSNPIGMTGGSSLLFGAVDAIFDWREDTAARKRNGPVFWLQTATKFALTPIGAVLLVAEFAWDLLMLRHPRLFVLKWNELFSLAEFHDIVCPEKSNDIFYADLAISRYCNDPYLYQWNRMRAMVFELQQYLNDVKLGLGMPESNLLLQSDIAAYQSIKRLCVEDIEAGLAAHYESHINEFPFPPTLGRELIKGARPIHHYLAMRAEVSRTKIADSRSPDLTHLLCDRYHTDMPAWKILRLLDEAAPFTPAISRHITQNDLIDMVDCGILLRISDFEFRFSDQFERAFTEWLNSRYLAVSIDQFEPIANALIPDFFVYQGKLFIRPA